MNQPPAEGVSVLFRADCLNFIRSQATERGCSLSRVVNECILLAKQTAEEIEALDNNNEGA